MGLPYRKSLGVEAEVAGAAWREDRQGGLADALRAHTRSLHTQVERSGIVQQVLQGRVSRYGYALFVRNLLPAYQQMERGLERHRHTPGVRAAAQPAVYRARALESDLEGLCGRAWRRSLPVLPAGDRYARRVAMAAKGDGGRLVAHAYVRYLGDLSGGQALKKLLTRTLGLGPGELSLYDFPEATSSEKLRVAYRAAIDRAAFEIVDVEGVIAEAAMAFRLNIEVSEGAREAAARCEKPPSKSPPC